MSIPSRSPLRMAGAALYSGGVNTGEMMTARGGVVAGSLFSGALFSGTTQPAASVGAVQLSNAGEMLLFSGPGRLNSIVLHASVFVLSGPGTVFYDNGTLTSGGPFAASGHKILANTNAPAAYALLGAAASGYLSPAGAVIAVDMPFASGLALNTKSGAPGFTVSWTPEVNPPVVV